MAAMPQEAMASRCTLQLPFSPPALWCSLPFSAHFMRERGRKRRENKAPTNVGNSNAAQLGRGGESETPKAIDLDRHGPASGPPLQDVGHADDFEAIAEDM